MTQPLEATIRVLDRVVKASFTISGPGAAVEPLPIDGLLFVYDDGSPIQPAEDRDKE